MDKGALENRIEKTVTMCVFLLIAHPQMLQKNGTGNGASAKTGRTLTGRLFAANAMEYHRMDGGGNSARIAALKWKEVKKMRIDEAIRILEGIRGYQSEGFYKDAVSAGIAALHEIGKSNWIPYSEKRPDLWGEYLTYNAENGAMYVLSFSPADNTFGIYDDNITHWMALPEPPETKED